MSDQQSHVQDQAELQQPDRQVDRQAERWAVVLAIVQMAGILGRLIYETLLSHQRTPYAMLDWVQWFCTMF